MMQANQIRQHVRFGATAMTTDNLAKYVLLTDEHTQRDPSNKDADLAAVQAIAQAAVNVELFTIPLYMVAMYSIQGTHQITGDNDFYVGRQWPGRAPEPSPKADDANALAFNLTFKVFIEEMLHLQLAANLCQALGRKPSFMKLSPECASYGWTCYSNSPVIPHILDFRDTEKCYSDIRVNLDEMNEGQVKLFQAIEENDDAARAIIREECREKYFPSVPFADWTPDCDVDDLPMFGTIGCMYSCLWQYLQINYSDGTKIWDSIDATSCGLQRDLFNLVTKYDMVKRSSGHPAAEYPGFRADVDLKATADERSQEVMRIINAITDQGEGSGVVTALRQVQGDGLLKAVETDFQANYENLKADYKGYDESGCPLPVSGDAFARGSSPNVSYDHREAFGQVMELVQAGRVETWNAWFAAGNQWTKELLQPDATIVSKYKIPSAAAVADALVQLRADDATENYKMLSYAATGAIYGVIRVLESYWASSDVEFPYPAMAGSGDRVSICWAITGKAPNLAAGICERKKNQLNHACQGMALGKDASDPAVCAEVAIFHTCKGSNQCKGEGGCGFVAGNGCGGATVGDTFRATDGEANCKQPATGVGGDTCSPPTEGNTCHPPGRDVLCNQPAKVSFKDGCPAPPGPFNAPADNICGSLGGCAVPISASQLFPMPSKTWAMGSMNVWDITYDGDSVCVGTIPYEVGQPVSEVAWQAYTKVLDYRKEPSPGDQPKPSNIRLAFPPST
jgi:ferritin-like protein